MTSRPRDVRTQVYLTAEQHRAAMELGRRSGRSLASLVREALDAYLAQSPGDRADWADDPAMALIGTFSGKPRQRPREALDEAIDRELYGEIDWSSQTPPGSSRPGSTPRPATKTPPKRGGSSRSAGRSSSRRT